MTDLCIVDGFCGAGGASLAIEMALGQSPTIGLNHDEDAIAVHAINHPSTIHYEQDIYMVRPEVATGGQSPYCAWFSPDCTHHSRAKGGKPLSNARRGLPRGVTSWASRVRPRLIIVENVPEMLTWGPLDDDGRPRTKDLGRYFRHWIGTFRKLGYSVQWKKLRACDYGAPTTRERLYVIARLDGAPEWPAPTHGEPGNLFGLPPFRTAADCIDWSVPCRSIFDRDKPLVAKTLARIARGLDKFVFNDPNPYIVRGGVPFLIQKGFGERQGQDPRTFDIRRPLSTVVAGGVKHELVVAFLARHFGGTGTAGSRLDEPTRTVTTQDHHALVEAVLDGEPDRSEQVAAFLKKPAIVTVHGVPHRITDIRTRHLIPRELARAQSFPDSYIIDRGANVKRLSLSAQVRLIGNSVCPLVGAALVRANCEDIAERRAA